MNIGPIQLKVPFCQAGLAGYSDRAMRIVARRHGCPYAVTEALLDTIMLSGGMGLKKSIDILVDANGLPRTPTVAEIFTPAFLPDEKDLPKKLF